MPVDPLVRLVGLIQPSLPMFLADCGLWSYPGPEEIRLALADLVADLRNVADRAALVLDERDLARPRVAYPISFTAWHDVDLGHILPRVVEAFGRQQPELERLAATPDDAAAADLAADALRSVRHHTGVLVSLAAKLRAGLDPKPGGVPL